MSKHIVVSRKSKLVTLILCSALGMFGGHRFYVGKELSAIAYLLSFGVFGFGWIVDLLKILRNEFTDEMGHIISDEED